VPDHGIGDAGEIWRQRIAGDSAGFYQVVFAAGIVERQPVAIVMADEMDDIGTEMCRRAR
jgi:hypothetical protein